MTNRPHGQPLLAESAARRTAVGMSRARINRQKMMSGDQCHCEAALPWLLFILRTKLCAPADNGAATEQGLAFQAPKAHGFLEQLCNAGEREIKET